MKKFVTSLITLLMVFALCFGLTATPAHAQTIRPWTGACTGDGTATGAATIQGLSCLIANVLSVAVTIVGLVGFVMMIVGAFSYMMSGGSSKSTEEAKNTFLFAIVGVAVALSAFIILNLITAFTGVDTILQLRIPDSSDQF